MLGINKKTLNRYIMFSKKLRFISKLADDNLIIY